MAINVKELFDNLLHIGHKAERWNPRMKPFLWGKREGVHLFDLDQTAEKLDLAEKFLKGLKVQNKKVLIVGTKPQASLLIERAIPAGDNNIFTISRKWTPGLLTNFKELRKRIDFFLTLRTQFETGDINKYTKKEVSRFAKELEKLRVSYEGVSQMKKTPDLIIVLDAVTDRLAIDEANVAGVPVMAILDANANPEGVDYPIPGNDDSVKSIGYVLNKLLAAVK